jgi:hypothetical protein
MSEAKNEETSPTTEGSEVERRVIRPINCDQVAWLLDIAERHLPPQKTPRVCQQREMQKYAMLYEVMEVANLQFADDSARWNGTPNKARDYGSKDV